MAVDFYRGLMVKVCEFQKNTPTDSPSGGGIDSYSDLLRCRGYLRKKSGINVLENGENYFDDKFELITDFIQDLFDNLSVSLKVIISGKTYSVNAWEQMEEKRFYLKLQLSVKK